MGYWEQRGAQGGDASGQVIVYTDDNNKVHYPGDEGYQLISGEGFQALAESPSGVVHEYDYPAVVAGEPSDPSVAGAGDESQVEQVQEAAPNLQVIEGEQQ